MLSWNPKILVKIMQIGIDTNLQIKNFSEKKGHHHPAMGPVSKSIPPLNTSQIFDMYTV